MEAILIQILLSCFPQKDIINFSLKKLRIKNHHILFILAHIFVTFVLRAFYLRGIDQF
jgi:hypothetical protein